MYALAAPTAPAEAAQEAAKLADKGQRIDKKKAKELIDKFSDKTPPTNGKPPNPAKPATVVTVEVKPDVPGVAVSGDCPKGGDHERGADGTCDKCLDPPADLGPQRGPASVPQIEAQTKQVERELAADVPGPLFSKLLEHLRQCTLLLDQINKLAPNETKRVEVFDSLECANMSIQEWRRKAKK